MIPHSDASKGPAEWFTGNVEIQSLKPMSENSKLSISSVRFAAGARSAWHAHPHGQMLYVTEGVGVVQKRGEQIQRIRPGDAIWTEPGEEHWHGASSGQPMAHLAIQEADEKGNFADWGQQVTDEEYNQQPKA